jgi:hypothetical protein
MPRMHRRFPDQGGFSSSRKATGRENPLPPPLGTGAKNRGVPVAIAR